MNINYLKKVSLITVLALVLNACASYEHHGIQGNGNVISTTRATTSYDAITCSGAMDFVLVKGTEGEISITGESNLIPYILTEVEGNTLIVKVKEGINIRPSHNKDVLINIPFEDIFDVSLTGSGDLTTKNTINSEQLMVGITGSGDIILDVNTTTVDAKVTGSGDLSLEGQTENLNVNVTGSGDFNGYNLQTKNTDVSVNGSGDARVNTQTYLKARVSGSGDIEYKGNPEKEDSKVSGSGSISKA
ncbi:head GIN domain-containing protein [Formosa haliotis]|uniref:head GIN domain-containing protein n=1 Tax=Formosa haliotis TaxID=1555194 RepID=UPI0008242EC8|nr:head GIN domain-containing protein [Formosa haliotis]